MKKISWCQHYSRDLQIIKRVFASLKNVTDKNYVRAEISNFTSLLCFISKFKCAKFTETKFMSIIA